MKKKAEDSYLLLQLIGALFLTVVTFGGFAIYFILKYYLCSEHGHNCSACSLRRICERFHEKPGELG